MTAHYVCTLGIALATYFLRQAMLKNITGRKKRSLYEEEDNPGQIQTGRITFYVYFLYEKHIMKSEILSFVYFAYLKKLFGQIEK